MSLTNETAVTYTFAENMPFILVIERANTAGSSYGGLYIGWAQNNGHVTPVLETTYCTVSYSGKTLTMTASTTNMTARIIKLPDNR